MAVRAYSSDDQRQATLSAISYARVKSLSGHVQVKAGIPAPVLNAVAGGMTRLLSTWARQQRKFIDELDLRIERRHLRGLF